MINLTTGKINQDLRFQLVCDWYNTKTDEINLDYK